jgi:hypothetical protein
MVSNPQEFVDSWWHGNDIVSACECLNLELARLELRPISAEALNTTQAVADENEARRHQIGIAARYANQQLAELGRSERVRAFRKEADWPNKETDEPLWLVVEPVKHSQLLAELGAPEDIEQEYDASIRLATPDSSRSEGPRIPRGNSELELFIQDQIRKQNWPLALEAIGRLRAGGNPDVLLTLSWISTLRSAGRTQEAVAAWCATADAWLRGEPKVWQSQWITLEKLHRKLGLSENDQIARIRERQKTAPR